MQVLLLILQAIIALPKIIEFINSINSKLKDEQSKKREGEHDDALTELENAKGAKNVKKAVDRWIDS